ncbi:hypothetical protein IV203_026815 [Nitzschia inconspicua]|uniref:Uncharacterized protein n=1 Tax=Nitzschia inconspicua TaxID=303405 RepID=A0A9K3LJC8_9STRA|nr:hypothetical protein IV203_026815 [Nitzschia inconspicua]
MTKSMQESDNKNNSNNSGPSPSLVENDDDLTTTTTTSSFYHHHHPSLHPSSHGNDDDDDDNNDYNIPSSSTQQYRKNCNNCNDEHRHRLHPEYLSSSTTEDSSECPNDHQEKEQPYTTLDTLIGGIGSNSSGGYDPDDYSTTSASFAGPHRHSMTAAVALTTVAASASTSTSASVIDEDHIGHSNNNHHHHHHHHHESHHTTTATTTSYKHLQGKLSRPRRRTAAVVQANNNHHHSRHHNKRSSRTDASVASESSENSRFSRFSTTTTSNRFSRGFKSQQQIHQTLLPQHLQQHQQSHQQQHNRTHQSLSYNSLFGLGTTQHTNSSIGSGSIGNTATPHLSSSSSSSLTQHEYQKHHHPNEPSMSLLSLLYSHHQQHKSYSSGSQNDHDSPNSPTGFSPPNLPSLKAVVSELFIICSLHCRYKLRSIRKPCRRLRQRLLYALITGSALLVALTGWIVVDFYMDAVAVCTPPPQSYGSSNFASFLADTDNVAASLDAGTEQEEKEQGHNNDDHNDDEDESSRRPLVEYYVHGRGIGHYARSVAIVERLNRAGIDVRMFLTRAAMWRAMHEDAKSMLMMEDVDDVNGQHVQPTRRGKTTAISVSSITPNQNVADVVSTVVERVSGDCEVSASSGRYPQLVISDGDFPGMLRAELGGIPSVGIAHGQLFSIAQKPTWVKNVPILNRAWNNQGTLNYVSGLFTEWQIATHFCFLESKYASGTVARAPLRPEVLQMAAARKYAREGKLYYKKHRSLPQGSRVRELLLLDAEKEGNKSNDTTQHHDVEHDKPRRKLVIGYFRDRNGEIIVKALLDAGFDVLLFDNAYYKDMVNDPSRYGAKWVVRNHERERKNGLIRVGNDQGKVVGTATNETSISENNEPLQRRLKGLLERSSPRLIRVADRSLFVPLMHVADGVASSAGSQLMSECIYAHMPLYALYREEDDEQRLNVELSHHMDAPCHRPLVFGASFESLSYALKSNDTHYATHNNRSPILESLAAFIREVQASRVSETYYRNSNLISQGGWDNSSDFEDGWFDDEDPFRGLPDAAAIILEIVKQVVQKQR